VTGRHEANVSGGDDAEVLLELEYRVHRPVARVVEKQAELKSTAAQ
jgi:hypothetical protein